MTSHTLHRRTILRGCGGALSVVLIGCLGGSAPTRRTVEMTDDLTFDPETVTVPQGGTVVWENDGSVAHTVTADTEAIPDGTAYFASGGFDSERAARRDISGGLLEPGETFEHTFEQPGAYGYYCIPHESSGMTGTVRVTD